MGGTYYNAIVSGRAGLALAVADERVYSVDADSMELVERRAEDFHQLFGGAKDFEFYENVSRSQIDELLSEAVNREQALSLFLVVVDESMPDDIRYDCSVDLEEMLADIKVKEHLESILYSAPLPPGVEQARWLAGIPEEHERVRELLDRLFELQPAIRRVRFALDAALESVGFSETKSQEIDAALVRSGVLRYLAIEMEKRGLASAFPKFICNNLLGRHIRPERCRKLLRALCHHLRESGTIFPREGLQVDQLSQLIENLKRRKINQEKRRGPANLNRVLRPKKRRCRRVKVARHNLLRK